MQAKDVMTTNVITATPEMETRDAARILMEKGVSALPVVSANGELVGMVSEGDLLRQVQTSQDRRPSWWLRLFQGADDKALDYVKAHARHVRDVMTRDVVTVTEEASISSIAHLLEAKRVKRVPVVKEGKVVGIVSRANLLHGLSAQTGISAASTGDQALRKQLMDELREAVPNAHLINVIVTDGVVQLMGAVETQAEKTAIDVVLDNVSGVKKIENDVTVLPFNVSSGWA